MTMSHQATVTAIHVAPGSRLAMKSVSEVEAVEQKGLVGDRYFGTKHRHVSVQSQADLDQAAELHGSAIRAQDTRRNITISSGSIPSKPGERIQIGQVELEVVRIAAPCKLLDDVIGPGAKTALRRKAGTIFRLLSSGTIRIGDQVHLPVEVRSD